MSVLLEALKKAAAEKERQKPQTDEKSLPESSHSEVVESIPAPQFEMKEPASQDASLDTEENFQSEALALNFNFEMPEDKPSEAQPPQQAHLESDFSIRQEGADDTVEKISETLNPLLENDSNDQELEKNSGSFRALEEDDNEVGLTTKSPEKPENEAEPFSFKLSEPSGTVSEPNTPEGVDLETRLALDEGGVSSVPESVSEINELSEQYEHHDQASDSSFLEEEILKDTPKQPEVNIEDLPEPEIEVISDPNVANKENASSKTEDSYDWSLDQIPGYQSPQTANQQKQKAKKILDSMTPPQKTKRNRSSILLGILASVGVLLGLGYYGLHYYQQMSSQVDQDLKRYDVKITPIKPKTDPVEPALSNDDSMVKVEEEVLQQPEMEEHLVVDEQLFDDSEEESPLENVDYAETQEPVVDEATLVNCVITEDEKTENLKPETTASRSNIAKQVKPVQPPVKKKTYTAEKPVIKIEPKKSSEQLGYEAYQAGDYNKAKGHYLEAVQRNKRSIAGLFGLGAVATQKGEKFKAMEYYRKILRLDPNNSLAQKALITLEVSRTAADENLEKLKSLSDDYPEDATVKFAMGNHYAKKQDWVEAQKYYFNAYQKSPNNPNYAVNLAVSLDRLGEYSLAKKYYEEALAKSTPANTLYDMKPIKKRLSTINSYLAGAN